MAPMMPFLRPLALPRTSTVKHFLRFSTSPRCRAEAQANDPNLVASRTAPPTYPPPSMKSLPRPKPGNAIGSRRTRQPAKARPYPTRHPSHHHHHHHHHPQPAVPTLLIPEEAVPALPPHQCAPNLPYFVTRSAGNELPIYTLTKRGGNLKMTRVKNIDGRIEMLRDELRRALGLQEKECSVNPVTRQVMLKGHCKPQVEKFLRDRLF